MRKIILLLRRNAMILFSSEFLNTGFIGSRGIGTMFRTMIIVVEYMKVYTSGEPLYTSMDNALDTSGYKHQTSFHSATQSPIPVTVHVLYTHTLSVYGCGIRPVTQVTQPYRGYPPMLFITWTCVYYVHSQDVRFL